LKFAVSTIIPVLNDNAALRRCVAALRGCTQSDFNQIIIADGGASDECQAIAQEYGAEYVCSECGRGRQMNAGAAVAAGEWLWFLHADCVPAQDAIAAILELDAGTEWGCFRHRIGAANPWLRVIETADNLRARVMRLPYGDQGIFVRADCFRAVGGMQVVPLMEDVMLSKALAERSAPRILKPVLVTDARRWIQHGVLKTMLMNWRMMLEFSVLKRTPEELAKRYYASGRNKADE